MRAYSEPPPRPPRYNSNDRGSPKAHFPSPAAVHFRVLIFAAAIDRAAALRVEKRRDRESNRQGASRGRARLVIDAARAGDGSASGV